MYRCGQLALRRAAPLGDRINSQKSTQTGIYSRYISRFNHLDKNPGGGRRRPPPTQARRPPPRPLAAAQPESISPDITVKLGEGGPNDSEIWNISDNRKSGQPEEALRILLSNNALIVTRQLEMLNVFIGFEQCNKYLITNEREETVGYIVEEPRGFLSILSRQILRTHRPFSALVMDASGSPILWLRRPFAWINSRMHVQKLLSGHKDLPSSKQFDSPVLESFAEVQQRWHLWRRRYDIFLREEHEPILSEVTKPQPELQLELFRQFARIDEGFLAWDFRAADSQGEEIASIKRAFRGFGLELFTDTGQYFLKFSSDELGPGRPGRNLSINERALILALAVNIDFDYFSRHSHGPTGFFWFGDGGDV